MFAIGWESDEIQAGGLIYFDTVTNWNRSYTGQVTKHPVDGSGTITDHYMKNNPVFTMSAVISGTDISTSPINLVDELGNTPYNVKEAPTAVQVGSSDQSLLSKFIPNVFGQFLPDRLPEVIMDEGFGDSIEEIQDILINLQSGEGYNQITGKFETLIRPVTLYETSGSTLVRKLPAANSYLVITAINFREDTESGYALFADITFEQVRVANLQRVVIPKDVRVTLKKKATPKKSLGKCDSTIKDTSASGQTPSEQNTSASVEANWQNTTGILPIPQ